jgi:hypothetical protein
MLNRQALRKPCVITPHEQKRMPKPQVSLAGILLSWNERRAQHTDPVLFQRD